MPRIQTAAFLTMLLLVPCAHSQDGGPRLELEGLAGQIRTVGLGELSIADPREHKAWFVRPLGVDRTSAVAGSSSTGRRAVIELAGGDVVHGRVVGGAGERMTVELAGGIRLPIDILNIRRVQPKSMVVGEVLVLSAPVEGDRVYRRVGEKVDPIDGTVDGFTADGVSFDSPTIGLRTYRWSEIAALFVEVLDDDRDGDVDAAACPVVIDLSDGSRLGGTLIGLESSGCRLTLAGVDVVLPWGIVHEVAVDDGSYAFLSERAATAEEGRGAPFDDELGMVWDHRMDRCVSGEPLREGGVVVRRGVGMHAPTRVTWRLDAGYTTLHGRVAIDDSSRLHPAKARGSVIFRVRLDGKVVWESPLVHGGDGSVTIPAVDLGGAQELTLEADMAGDFAGDRANWLRVLLVR